MSEKINEMACNFCNEIMCSVCEKRTCIDSVKQAYLAGAEPREKQIAELEKENAELEKKLTEKVTLESLDIVSAKINGLENNLTKAKKLLAKWVELFKPKVGNIPPTPIQVDTEQFLKECK